MADRGAGFDIAKEARWLCARHHPGRNPPMTGSEVRTPVPHCGCEQVAEILQKARAAGRAEGIEEAAAKADADCAEWNVLAERSIGAGHAGLASDRRLRADACRLTAAEIRALLSGARAKREGK